MAVKKNIKNRGVLAVLLLAMGFLTSCSSYHRETSYEYPAWTPDGKIVYWYSSYTVKRSFLLNGLEGTDGGTYLYMMDADGTNEKKLLDKPSYGAFQLSVSTDGKKILNGGQVLELATGKELAKNEDVTPGDWSPDSTKIVFVKNTIKIWDLTTNQVKDTGLVGYRPSWKYNDYFIYSFYAVDTPVFDFDSSNQVNLNGEIIATFNWLFEPQYENSKAYIIGTDSSTSRKKINIKTKQVVNIYSVNENSGDLRLSPTGDKLLWNVSDNPLRKSIWIENIDGSGKKCLKQSTYD